LLHRKRTGLGVSIDVAQAEATAYMLGVSYLETSVNGAHPEPRGNQGRTAAPHGCYRCLGDDRWCVVSVESETQWRSLCRVMQRGDLADDPRFADRAARQGHRSELDAIVADWASKRSPEEVMRLLQAEGVAAGVVQNGEDLVGDPQLRHRNYYEGYPDSPVGPMEVPRGALLFTGMDDEVIPSSPSLGQHTVEILRDLLGYDDAAIDQMEKDGVLS
jgi:benzylsuccinate CoA-transferase BbsF subunit